MATYVILSRISPEAFQKPRDFRTVATAVAERIKNECPGVRWQQSYATLGRFDVVDIVDSDEPNQVEKAAMIIRAEGHATTETLTATPWKQFLERL